MGFSSRWQNNTPSHTLSLGSKPPQGQPLSLSLGVSQNPAMSCKGMTSVSIATGTSWKEEEGERGSTCWRTSQITPAPPSAACPLKEMLLNSKVVKRVGHRRKMRSKKRKNNPPRGKELTFTEQAPAICQELYICISINPHTLPRRKMLLVYFIIKETEAQEE